MDLATAFGVFAGVLHLAGYLKYHQIMSHHLGHEPNTASWFMWGVGGAIELGIYGSLVNDWAKDSLPFVCSVGAFVTMSRLYFSGAKFQIKPADMPYIALDLLVVCYYLVTGDTVVSNWLLALDIVVSYIPMLKDVSNEPKSEHPTPWLIWTLSYLSLAVAVVLQRGSWLEILYPVLYFVLHGAVWALARRAAKRD